MRESMIETDCANKTFTFDVEPETNTRTISTTRMAQILRALGAIIIVAASSTFLFQHWGAGSDMNRYYLLLAFTAILSLGGFFCGLRLQESKGARTLLGLTLAITPINFAVVAGLIYSQFSLDGALTVIPAYVSWLAPSASAALVATGIGLLVLAPLSYLSFLVLNREGAKPLAVAFLLTNLSLWLPTREPAIIGLVVALLATGLCWLELRKLRGMSTFEGRVSRLLLWVAPVILIGRTFTLYAANSFFTGCLLAVLALLGFSFGPVLTGEVRNQRLVQWVASVLMMLSWSCFAETLLGTFQIAGAAVLPLCFLPVSAMLLLVSYRVVGGGSMHRRLACGISLLATSVNLVIYPGILASLLCMGVAIAILVYGFVVEQKVIFFTGVAGVLFGLGYHCKYAFRFYSLTSWGSLALLGVSIIIAASLLEKNQGRIRNRVSAFRTRMQEWDA